jgi:hypothetical protein
MSVENLNETSAPQPRTRRERRAHRRKATLWQGKLAADGRVFPCIVLNVSLTGAMLRLEAPLIRDGRAELSVPRLGTIAAEVVWQIPEQRILGLRFIAPAEGLASILHEDPPAG